MSLAIIENQPQRRSGGCAGIFFQLLDWNRRLAKKKLFSKKLLPPVRSVNRPAKKFGGDEKIPMAKLILIANENRGGFPSVNKADADENPGNAMRAPGLVARLMGLESIPVIDHERPRKALDSEYYYDHDKSREYSRLDQDLCHEVAGQGKLDSSRPQKLQKTGGILERQPANAARFSPDVIHRSVFARSRKQHHKLASPVKSPRLFSRDNQARLMQAATKILEPGLQPRSRSRRAITCNGVSESESLGSESAIALKRSDDLQNDSLIGSCRSCGKTVEFLQLRCSMKESLMSHDVSAASNFSNVSSLDCGVEDTKLHDRTALLAVQAKFDTHGKAQDSMERKHLVASDRVKCKPPQEINPKVSSKIKTLRRAELPMSRDSVVPGSKLCTRRQIDGDANEFMRSKHFVGVKKNLNSSPPWKSASKASKSNGLSTEGNVWEKGAARKRRSCSNLQMGNKTASNPSFMKQRGSQSDIINRKESRLIYGQAINRNRAKNEPQKRVNVETLSSGDTGIVSFTFSSPMKHKSLSFVKEATSRKSMDQMEQKDDTFQPKVLLNANKDILPSPRRKCRLRGDELSNLLEEKIRELNSLDQTDVGISDTSGRSTASILEELISALTSGESVVQSIHNDAELEVSTPKDNFIDSFTMLSNGTANGNKKFDFNQNLQVEENPFNAASMISDSNHPSPISMFDVSFSSESCSVGSFNGSFDMKGSKTRMGLAHKCNKTESLNLDSDLLDSANSVEFSRSDNEKILSSSRSDSSLHSIQSYDVEILGTKVGFSNEAISKTKLLLETILFFDSDDTLQPSVDLFLLDIFTSISDAFFTRMKSSLSLSEANDYNHIKDFLFDFLIESLVSRFNQFCMSGYMIWLKLRMLLSKNHLLKEIHGEIGGLMELDGKVLDDLAKQELSSSTIMWTAFEAEASLTAMDIESAILQDLMDEMVMDLVMMSKLVNDFN